MKCVIPGANCKILGRAIHALAKIGEEMYVQPREKSLSFRCVSMSNSAYCDFTFQDVYFSSYTFGNLEEEDALKCKISMRSALTVFKSPAVIDKLVETCHIRLEPNADQLIFIFKFKNSVIKTFFLPIIDCEQLSVPYSKDNLPNKLSAKPRVFMDAVQNFQQNLVEVTVEVTPQKLLMRNYVDETSTMANSTRTQLGLTIGEFDEYIVGQEAQITFCMKELRAILTFADTVSLPINVYFETTGRPVLFDLKSVTFEANLILSTLNPDGDDMSISTVQEMRQPVRKRAASKKTPRQLAKASSKRPTNKSNKSASTKSNASTIRNEANRSDVSTRTNEANRSDVLERMDVDDNDASNSAIIGVNLNLTDIHSRNNLTPRRELENTSQESVRKRAHVSQTSSAGRASTSGRSSPLVSTLNPSTIRSTEHSIFSPAWRKGSSNNNKEDNLDVQMNEVNLDVPTIEDNLDLRMDEDEISGSPPQPTKRARLIFKKCYETTFHPTMLPGHDSILADDSDEEQ